MTPRSHADLDKENKPAKRVGCIVIAVAAIAVAAWQFSFPVREAKRWDHCLGRPLADCRLPADYFDASPCPKFHECRTDPPGATYMSAELSTHRGTIWDSYAYAVIALDKDGRIVKVEIKRFYSAL